jgi:hypothetical protein
MPAWPKSFYTFGANLLTAGAEWRLRQKRSAIGAQQRTFSVLTRHLAATSFWREAGVVSNLLYADFQTRIPPRSYEQFTPAIERMRHGEADVLWPGQCALFAQSAGTTTGSKKCLPVTEELLGHFRRAAFDSLLYYTVRVKHAAVFRGRHLFLGGSTVLTPLTESTPHEAFTGNLSGISALNLPKWVEQHLYEPGAAIAQIDDWTTRLAAMVERTSSLDITMLAGLPNWALLLATALREKSARGKERISNLEGLWPNFECFVHGGAPIGPFQDELRLALGPTVSFHEIYPATEAFVAAQDLEPGSGLRLMADTGIFFEFLPMTDFDETRLEQLGHKAVPLAGVKTGVDYALLITTPAGLARYVLGDVVRFISTEPPRLIYVGSTKLQLNGFGERVTEKDVTESFTAVCRRHRWSPVNFHVASICIPSLTGQNRGHHEWWVELKPGTEKTPTGPQMTVELDVELQKLNETYAAKRKSGAIDAPVVHLVMPGVFKHWLSFNQKWGGLHKMPRCQSDRRVADELAQITSFPRD